MSTKKAEKEKKEASGTELFLSRELSWMDFNSRVLDEAATPANPVLERLKFIAIFSSNLDEFFMVRVAGLHQLVKRNRDVPDPAGNHASAQLAGIRRKLEKLLKRQYSLLYDRIFPELAAKGVELVKFDTLEGTRRSAVTNHFINQILPVLTPLAIDVAHPFPILSSGAIEIAVTMKSPQREEFMHAFVEVPDGLPRFVPVPGNRGGLRFLLLEDLIMAHLPLLFHGCEIQECLPFRLTRDMDFTIEEDGIEDLMQSIEKNLIQRRRREPIRLEIPAGHKGELTEWLREEFALEKPFVYEVPGMLHLKNCFELVGKIKLPGLLEPAWPPVTPAAFRGDRNIFETISEQGPILIAPPFHSFEPVVRLLESAAEDPDVLAIKQTLYRVSGNSPVVHALRRAAENGKQVTVVVELKARFDENNNIVWARLLEESGAHVIYGVSGLKVHCKALLVVRREDGAIRRYAHLSTGNYNDKTATLYTDLGIMSCDPDLCFDIANLFNVLSGYSAPPEHWRKVAVSPFQLREKIVSLIEREIRNSTPEKPGRIIAKMNSLSDESMIRLLHRAADAGVEIDLIVRGICCYKPKPGQDNLRIVSIVDRFLEHSRLFYFYNNGDEEFYLSSADWMFRNLSRRVELLFPVENERIRKICFQLLHFQLNDQEKCRRMQASGNYTKCQEVEQHGPFRSQFNSYKYLKKLAAEEENADHSGALKVFTSQEQSETARGRENHEEDPQ